VRVLLTVQYLGTRYAGWQLQAGVATVQQVLENALSQLYHAPIRVHGAGRTDAGVHAHGQRAHFDAPSVIPSRGLVLGLNQLLPPDVRVLAADPIPDEMHARFAAHRKTYEYRIWNASVADVFAAETHAHVAQPLDVTVMANAAEALVGTHDFAVFTVADPEVSSTTRTIESFSVRREGQAIAMRVTADGFLRYQVRRMAGSLIEIGRARLAPADLWKEARWTAPARGLVLLSIEY
jgi:tRNA pseudouridine38-40 synthase